MARRVTVHPVITAVMVAEVVDLEEASWAESSVGWPVAGCRIGCRAMETILATASLQPVLVEAGRSMNPVATAVSPAAPAGALTVARPVAAIVAPPMVDRAGRSK